MTNQQQAVEIARVIGIDVIYSDDFGPVVNDFTVKGACLRSFEPHSDWRDIGLITKRLNKDGYSVSFLRDGLSEKVGLVNFFDERHAGTMFMDTSDKPADQGGVAEVFCKAYGIEVTE